MNANEQTLPSKKSTIFSLLCDDKEPSFSESNSPSGVFFNSNQQNSTLTTPSPPTLQTKRSFEDVHTPVLLPSISSQLADSSQNLGSSTSKRPKTEDEYSHYNIPLSKESVMDVATLLLDLDRRDKLSSNIKHNEEYTGGSLVTNSSSINNNLPGINSNTPREFFNNITLSTVNPGWSGNRQVLITDNSSDNAMPRRSSSLPSPAAIPQFNVAYMNPMSSSFPLPSYMQVPQANQIFPPSSSSSSNSPPMRRSSFPMNTQNNNNNGCNSNNNNDNNSANYQHNYFPASQQQNSFDEKAPPTPPTPQNNRPVKATDNAKESNQFTHTYFDDQWMTHYRELSKFKAIYGHVNVTRTLPEWRSLGNWVAEQRRKMRKGKLSRQQFEMLREIGFEWDRSYYFKAAVPSVYGTDESKSQNNSDG